MRTFLKKLFKENKIYLFSILFLVAWFALGVKGYLNDYSYSKKVENLFYVQQKCENIN